MQSNRTPQNNLKPKLASNRTAKTPLTPRLAVAPSTTATGSSQPSRNVRSSTATTPRANNAAYEDVTPVKAFLNNNVTPRSSSRKSRVGFDSASSTPGGTPINTPASSRPTSSIDFAPKEQPIGYAGSAVNGNKNAQAAVRPRSIPAQSSAQVTPTPRQPLSNLHNPLPPDAGSAKPTSPLFFHASEARPQEPVQAQKKAPVFFYADGKQDEAPPRHAASPPVSSVAKSQSGSKFFHADTIAEPKAPSPNPTPSPLSASPEPLNPSLHPGSAFPSPSPTKEWAHLSYRKGASQVIRPSLVSRTSGLSALSATNTPDVPDRSSRRSSLASYAMRGNHGKSASLSSIDSVADFKNVPPNEPSALSPSPLHTDNRVVSSGSLAESIASASSPPIHALSAPLSPGPASPTKTVQSALETMNELAANARRERKVLDLEISNSSLLAINRGLEKEVRKQQAELRRFRRMSRAGRFSMDTIGCSLDHPSFSTAHLGHLSDMSEEEAGGEPLEEEALSSDGDFDESQLSPSAQLERDETHRLGDEKRLQLDLSKHRGLLMDSQKMNQSLKRCMNWTEQLIKDGQKALEYHVRPSDLPARVLVVEADHDTTEVEESKGLLSPWSPLHRPNDDMDFLESPFFANAIERIVDRDSGVDVDGLEELLGPAIPGVSSPLSSPFEERIQRLQASIDALGAS